MDEKYMNMAFKEAEKAINVNEIPIGAVIVKNNKVIAKAYNTKEKNKNVICHAEILAICKASKVLDNWRLDDCDIYVTLDPCPMCASAIKQSRIKNVYSALENLNPENLEIIQNIFQSNDINASINFSSNLAIDKSRILLQDFFKNKR